MPLYLRRVEGCSWSKRGASARWSSYGTTKTNSGKGTRTMDRKASGCKQLSIGSCNRFVTRRTHVGRLDFSVGRNIGKIRGSSCPKERFPRLFYVRDLILIFNATRSSILIYYFDPSFSLRGQKRSWWFVWDLGQRVDPWFMPFHLFVLPHVGGSERIFHLSIMTLWTNSAVLILMDA